MDDSTRELLTRGREHYTAREYDKAEALLSRLARERLAYADVYEMLGVIYHQQGRLSDAESMFQEALRIDPNDIDAEANLTKAMSLQNQNRSPLTPP